MSKKSVVTYPIRKNRKGQLQVCLGLKKVRYTKGKWNGFGGKVEKGESLKEAAIRELEEEAGVKTQTKYLNYKAKIKYFERPDNWVINVFVCEKWKGKLSETEEMRPKWFDVNKLPYQKMWENDILWLFEVLTTDKKITGTIWHDKDNKVVKKDLKEVINI